MIEAYIRPTYQRLLVTPCAHRLHNKLSANQATIAATISGILVIPLLLLHLPWAAAITLLLSGYFDTLDGTLARLHNNSTPLGTMLDITSDRIVEASIVIGLYLVAPAQRAGLSLFMLTSILICVTTFLVAGIFAENSSNKSFHYSPGLIERPEAFAFFIAMMLLPHYFTPLAIMFSLLVLFTAYWRVHQFYTAHAKCN
ncbi:MAG: CDP-alcohol phosphatidyltransferase family protein [Gammaproteobacteria bacterium]